MTKLEQGDISGFDVMGYRLKDGSVNINGRKFDDFPKKLTLIGVTYNLEYIKKNDEDNKLPEDHGGKNIEWGIYL